MASIYSLLLFYYIEQAILCSVKIIYFQIQNHFIGLINFHQNACILPFISWCSTLCYWHKVCIYVRLCFFVPIFSIEEKSNFPKVVLSFSVDFISYLFNTVQKSNQKKYTVLDFSIQYPY